MQVRQRAKMQRQKIEMTNAGWRGMKESMLSSDPDDDETPLTDDGRAEGADRREEGSRLGASEGEADGLAVGCRLGREEGTVVGRKKANVGWGVGE
jgi:hypothetical protein